MKTVLCHGTFDLIHYGHILLFKRARELGDRLIVTLTSDEYVTKGPGRPVFNEEQRLEWVQAIRFVDEAYIIREKTGVAAIYEIMPDIYAKGRDTLQWTNVIAEEREAVERVGGELVYIDTGTVFHSGELLSGKYLAPREDKKSA